MAKGMIRRVVTAAVLTAVPVMCFAAPAAAQGTSGWHQAGSGGGGWRQQGGGFHQQGTIPWVQQGTIPWVQSASGPSDSASATSGLADAAGFDARF